MSPIYLHNGKLLIKDGALATSINCCCSGCDISDTILCLTITSEHTIYNYTCPPDLDLSSCGDRDCICEILVENCDYEEKVIQADLKLYAARVNGLTGLLDPAVPFSMVVLTDKGNGNPFHVLPLNVTNRGGGIVYGNISNEIVQCGIAAPGFFGNILNVEFVSIDHYGCIVNKWNGVSLYGCPASSGVIDGSHCFDSDDSNDFPLFFPTGGGGNSHPYLPPGEDCTNYHPGYYDANGNLIANINACFDPPDINEDGMTPCFHYYTSAGLVSLRFSLPCWEGLGEAPANRVSATATAPLDIPGPISAITMGPKGNNYAKIGRVAPTLTVSGGSGSGLVVTPTLLETKDSCNVPTWSIGSVSFKGGTGYVGGENLTVTAAIGDTTVTNAVLTVQTDPRSQPSLSASVTPGTGSSFSVNMTPNAGTPTTWGVNGVDVSGNGTGYEDNSPVIFSYDNGVVEQIPAVAHIRTNRLEPTVVANATGGNGAVLSVNLGSFFPQPDTFWVVNSVTVNNGGNGYSDGDPVNFVVTDGIQVGQAIGSVVTVKSVEPRENPNLTPYVWGLDGTTAGNGAILTATMTETVDGENEPAWEISSINIIDGGSGYQVGEYIWYNEYPGGFMDNPPYYILAFDGYVITGVDINGAITGIGLDPLIGGTGLYYKQQEGSSTGVIESITITNGGNYYKPTSSIWGVVVTNRGAYYYYTGIPTGVTIVNAGTYYREDSSIPGIPSPVTITINQLAPSNGNGAQLSAIIDTNTNSVDFGKITGVNIINGGNNYLAGETNQPGGARRSITTINATLTSFSPDPLEYSIIEPPDNSGPLLSPTPCE